MHSQSFRGYHNASLLPSPQVSLTVTLFLGTSRRLSFTMVPFYPSPQVSLRCSLPGSPGRSSVSFSASRGRFLPGDQHKGLTLSCGHSWWVGPSFQWVQPGLGHLGSQNTNPKGNPEHRQVACLLVRFGVPSLQPGRATSLAAQGAGVVGVSLESPEMLQKPVLGKQSTTLGELENSGLLCWWAQTVNIPSSEP